MNILKTLRNLALVGWLCVVMTSIALGATILALKLAATVTTMTAKVAATAAAHRKQLAKAKAKARLRRALVAVPVAGVGAAFYFEEQDYQEWLAENPGGTRQQYACEVAALSAEVIDEWLQEMPEKVRPSEEWLLSQVPECEEGET